MVDAFVTRAERELGPITREQLDEGWHRLRLERSRRAWTWPEPQGRRLRALLWLTGFAAAGAVVLAIMVGYRPFSAQPLRYTVEGPGARRGNAVETSAHAASRLLFSDESRVVLDASTRVTVDGLDTRGARIGLLDGTVDVFVKPRTNSSWLFAAGPFLVRVKGTSFRLAFAPSVGRLGLQMSSGQVEVLAPSGRMVVGAGETIELFATSPSSAGTTAPTPAIPSHQAATSAPEIRPTITRPRTAAASPHGRVGSQPAVEPATARAADAAASSMGAALPWTQWLSQGKFAQVVADAEKRGLEQVIAQARPADMTALADAARYIKRYSLSRQVLLAMRSRFTATDSANDASFFLGRLAEATSGAEPALAWYDTYLRDAPRGLYAKEAMGREMRLRAAGSPEQTRRIARQYLERFPQGPEAELARALVGASPE